jgi:precorrin isomerase
MLEKNLEDQILTQNTMIALLDEQGEITWIVSGYPTKKQKKQFQKIYVVTNSPSTILNILMFVEIQMLKFLVFIENLFKKRKKDE